MEMDQLKADIAAMKDQAPYTYSAAQVAERTAAILERMRQIIAGEVPAETQAGA